MSAIDEIDAALEQAADSYEDGDSEHQANLSRLLDIHERQLKRMVDEYQKQFDRFFAAYEQELKHFSETLSVERSKPMVTNKE